MIVAISKKHGRAIAVRTRGPIILFWPSVARATEYLESVGKRPDDFDLVVVDADVKARLAEQENVPTGALCFRELFS